MNTNTLNRSLSTKRKKGQIAGQIFIYIMATVVIGVIVLLGYQSIAGIFEKSCQAEQVAFSNAIKPLLEKYSTPGSINKDILAAPCGYEEICFVSAEKLTSSGQTVQECANQLIKQSVAQGNKQNIFVKSEGGIIPIGYADMLSLAQPPGAEGCLCIKQRNNNFYITFTGKGSSTAVSES